MSFLSLRNSNLLSLACIQITRQNPEMLRENFMTRTLRVCQKKSKTTDEMNFTTYESI